MSAALPPSLIRDTPPRRRAGAKLSVAAGILGVAAGIVVYTHGMPARPVADRAPPAPARIPVVTARVAARDLPISLAGIGSVQPLASVVVKVRVDGQLDSVFFTEGQEVREREKLAQIDPRQYEALLKQAEAMRVKDQVTLKNQRIDLARFTKLAKTGAATMQSVDTLAAQIGATEATIDADDAVVATAKLQLEFTTLRAPIDGRVGLRLVDPGSIVHGSDATGLVTITQMAPISVLFTLSQDDLPRIRKAMMGSGLKVEVSTRDGSRRLAEGDLTFLDSQVDPSNGQIRLRASFANTDRMLWPGTFVTTRLLLRMERGITAIADRAVLRGQKGPYVYVVKTDRTVEARLVAPGPSVDGFTAIRSGLAVGETVVVDGQSRLSPGATVQEQAPAATVVTP